MCHDTSEYLYQFTSLIVSVAFLTDSIFWTMWTSKLVLFLSIYTPCLSREQGKTPKYLNNSGKGIIVFITGLLYHRQGLHEEYGGQRQGGISTPSHRNLIFLFSSPRAGEYGYEDGWSEEGYYLYTGEGQRGDMTFTRGNIAIRNHQKEGKDLHLFEASSKKGFYRYIGQMLCIGYHKRSGKDITGKHRLQIIFELIPIGKFMTEETNAEIENELWQESLHDLKKRALSSSSFPTTGQRQVEIYNRSQAIKIYALKRANGTCEGCGKRAPFIKEDGRPYLEVHHLNRLSDGGPDHPERVIALCPNCHRQVHYSRDRQLFNAKLERIIAKIETKSVIT